MNTKTRQSSFAWLGTLFLTMLFFGSAHAQEANPYMGGPVTLVEAPNGAVINAKVLSTLPRVIYLKKTVEKIADGVWSIGGYSIANCTVIEAPDGLIVYDTGDYAEEGQHLREAIESKISKRPIKAIIYSHSHYALGGGAMVDDPASVTVLGHRELNETVEKNLEGGGLTGPIPEIGPVLSARAAVQFSNFLPSEGPDATLAAKLKFKEPAFLPVTRPVKDGEIVDVAGLKLQFFTKYISDDYSVTVWIPEKKVVLNNFFWPGTPNLYSLRGAAYRDPQEWINGLRALRDLQPEYLLNTHAVAVVGAERVHQTLTNYMDLIALTYDQSLRGILKGLGPDELRHFIYKPKHLTEPAYNEELYGETPWFAPAIFYYGLGWYDRDPTKLYQLPPAESSRRLVELIGGSDKVVAAARAAYDRKEYAWAAQLVRHVYLIEPENPEARKVMTDALRKLGQISISSIGRSFTLSEARALESKEKIPRIVPPKPEMIARTPELFVNYYRVRIDPRKSEEIDKVVAFDFGAKTVALHVRRGVAEYIDNPDAYYREADIVLSLDGSAWADLYLNRASFAGEVEAGKVRVTKGSAREAGEILATFDSFASI